MARLSRIQIFPLKSFDPVVVERVSVLPSGALENDRRWALFDEQGQFVNGKRTARVHPLRTQFDLNQGTVTFDTQGERQSFALNEDRARLEHWLSQQLGLTVHIREDVAHGFPDDSQAPGPTVIGAATLSDVASWYEGLEVDEVRLRFRANLEIDGEPPFWEDRLYGDEGTTVRFRIGAVEFEGTNPCQRCIVPTRSPVTGARYPEFARIFEARRREEFPAWAPPGRFDHFYRLAVNTRPATEKGGTLCVGDHVEIVA